MVKLVDVANQEIEQILANFPSYEAAVLPLFHLAYKHFGKIDDTVLREISDLTHISVDGINKLLLQYRRFWPRR